MDAVDPNVVRVLLVGRIYEEDEIFKLIKHTVLEFVRLTPTVFYSMDKNTK